MSWFDFKLFMLKHTYIPTDPSRSVSGTSPLVLNMLKTSTDLLVHTMNLLFIVGQLLGLLVFLEVLVGVMSFRYQNLQSANSEQFIREIQNKLILIGKFWSIQKVKHQQYNYFDICDIFNPFLAIYTLMNKNSFRSVLFNKILKFHATKYLFTNYKLNDLDTNDNFMLVCSCVCI